MVLYNEVYNFNTTQLLQTIHEKTFLNMLKSCNPLVNGTAVEIPKIKPTKTVFDYQPIK